METVVRPAPLLITLMPVPLSEPESASPAEVHRQALVRNSRAWRCFFALDAERAIVLRGRLPETRVTLEELDRVLGEVYETIEVSFRPMVRAGFPSRENSG